MIHKIELPLRALLAFEIGVFFGTLLFDFAGFMRRACHDGDKAMLQSSGLTGTRSSQLNALSEEGDEGGASHHGFDGQVVLENKLTWRIGRAFRHCGQRWIQQPFLNRANLRDECSRRFINFRLMLWIADIQPRHIQPNEAFQMLGGRQHFLELLRTAWLDADLAVVHPWQ